MTEQIFSAEDLRYDVDLCIEQAEAGLAQGFLSSLDEAIRVQLQIQREAQRAIRHGLEDLLHPLRQLHERIEIAIHRIELAQLLDELRHGESPPVLEWKWMGYEKTITGSRARGLDVTAAEQAVSRARRLESKWAQEDDEPRETTPTPREPRPRDPAVVQPSEPEVDAPSSLEPPEPPLELTTSVSLPSEPPTPPYQAPPTAPPEPELQETEQRPHPSRLGARYLELVESSLPSSGNGSKAALLILSALRRALTAEIGNLRGTRAAIFAALQRAGAMPKLPGDRASRDAMNNTLVHFDLAFTRQGAADWLLHLGDLREPSPELEAALRAEIQRLETQRLGRPWPPRPAVFET